MQPIPSKRDLDANCGSSGALTLSLLTAEVLLRLMGVTHPAFDQAGAVLGSSLIPYAKGRQGREGESFARINSARFRDREWSFRKPSGVFLPAFEPYLGFGHWN